jgi:hypothetical protein
MKSIFLLIFYAIISTNAVKPKLCVNCQFFTKDGFFTDNNFGKCLMFPKEEELDDNFLVTGIKSKKQIEYMYCSTARNFESRCGKEGRFYEEK